MKTYNYTINNELLLDVIDFSQFNDKKNVLVQIFCGQGKSTFQLILNSINNLLPSAVCIGCTTDGEIDEHMVYTLHTSICISVFENTTLKCDFVNSKNSYENGIQIAQKLVTDNTKLLILFTDSTHSNGEDFLSGVQDQNNQVMIAGGMAGDNGEFKHSYIGNNGKVLSHGVVGVSLNSDILSVENDYRFNWNPIGIEHTIDDMKDKRLYRISGMTPYEFYKKYLGIDVAKSLPVSGIEYPLVIERNGLLIARAVIKKHKDGSLSFAGSFQNGDKVRLAFGDVETILKNSLQAFSKKKNKNIQSFYIYSCMARRRYMPQSIQFEIEPFARIAPTSGFFTYGEFYHNNGHNELLNQTLTVVSLSESTITNDTQKSNIRILESTPAKHIKTFKALTHLIEESSRDYVKQAKSLEEEKKYSQELLDTQKLFIRHTVHETNTPLSVIMNAVELHKMEYGENKYVSHIEAAMKNMSNIYDDLSYLISKKQVLYKNQKINLCAYIQSRIDFFEPLASQVRLQFDFKSEKEQFFIHFNETKLQRIIDNNLTNAIKYSIENNIIYVSIILKADTCILEISTYSHKIENPEMIFEEYYRESDSKKGFGLGLNLVKRICDEENVGINITSNNEQTRFVYTFTLDT